ncbi:MAG: patatin-like phospholipase family protein [Gammaproteobacteria bacterium]|nr:patatin-like phospholipase family protein [Gammaproteobacteria bacterium]MBU1409710.1 patatin-like phospholipase family protein [Gammaproteobacteria bacterium]MBU1533442.1 patatin-like phospholipase family protein [Gammaproteobacteria bacterium]
MRRLPLLLLAALLAACAVPPPASTPPVPVHKPPLKIALVLGGGAARGFAHIGVIKSLEAQGIVPDIVVGTSAGSVVGALYASGMSGFELQNLALQMEEDMVADWTLPNRGVLKGEALQAFINQNVKNLTIQKMPKPLGVVATDLQSGEKVLFRRGDTGIAVRASSAVPGMIQPVEINGRDYVDGGLTSPVPAQSARAMGADFVIAVDISNVSRRDRLTGTLDVMLQTFAIMGHTISRHELKEADVVIRPNTAAVSSTDFEGRHLAILEGEKAAAAVMPELKARLAKAQAR